MANCEAAVVAYLRRVYGIAELPADIPRTIDRLTMIEIGREAATLLMLAALALAAARSLRGRLGLFAYAFGLWDLLYYAWLVPLIGWPDSLLDWDLLFLIPLPWWAPVLAPMLVALLMAVAGAALLRAEIEDRRLRLRAADWTLLAVSLLLALACFMGDALAALPRGREAILSLRPTDFAWTPFLLALAGMAAFTARLWTAARPPQDSP